MPAGGSRPCPTGCQCRKHVKPVGADSPNWVGDKITHKAMHQRVIRVRGSASSHRCLFCAERDLERPARDWAQIHETDGRDIAHYVPLCPKCHMNYDDGAGARWHPAHRAAVRDSLARRTPAQRAAGGMARRKLTEADVSDIRARLRDGERQADIARRYGVVQTTISRIKLGTTYSLAPLS